MGTWYDLIVTEILSLTHSLNKLQQVGAFLTRQGACGDSSAALQLITACLADCLPDAGVSICPYDEHIQVFLPDARVSAGKGIGLSDLPRADGLGFKALQVGSAVVSSPETNLHPARLADGAKAASALPLEYAEETLGVLYVYRYEQPSFSAADQLLLANFAVYAALALSLGRQAALSEQESGRKERELRRLRRAGMLISSRTSLKATLETILQVALDVTDAIYGIFRLVDRSGSHMVMQAISGVGLGKPAVETLEINEKSIMGTVALKREPIIISDLREGPWKSIYYPFDLELEMRSELAVPLIGASGRLEGVLNLESPNVNAFDQQDLYILQILATQAVVAIQEARLLDALQQVSALLTGQSPVLVYHRLVEQACDLLNVPVGLIWLQAGEELVLQAATDAAWQGMRIQMRGSLTAQVIAEGQPRALVYAEENPPPDLPYPDLPGFTHNGAALIVPLFTNQEDVALGAFSVYTAQNDPRNFDQSDWDRKVLDILGHYAALAMQSEAQREALRVAEDQRATTEAFAAIGDIAANLLHRLNNKVGTIPVRVEGIQDKCQSALEADPYLEKNLAEIERSASEAMQVVRESLFHLHPIQLAPVSVAGSVHEAIVSTRLPQGVALELEGLDLLPPVQAGPKRLGLVFSNLLDNASDAMGGVGHIRISGKVCNGQVEVRVSDNGPGIAPEIHERIFEFNYSARASAHPGKLGFGLWWVKSLMARFGGKVAVESDGKHGTTFILTLPQAKEDVWQTS